MIQLRQIYGKKPNATSNDYNNLHSISVNLKEDIKKHDQVTCAGLFWFMSIYPPNRAAKERITSLGSDSCGRGSIATV